MKTTLPWYVSAVDDMVMVEWTAIWKRALLFVFCTLALSACAIAVDRKFVRSTFKTAAASDARCAAFAREQHELAAQEEPQCGAGWAKSVFNAFGVPCATRVDDTLRLLKGERGQR